MKLGNGMDDGTFPVRWGMEKGEEVIMSRVNRRILMGSHTTTKMPAGKPS